MKNRDKRKIKLLQFHTEALCVNLNPLKKFVITEKKVLMMIIIMLLFVPSNI